MAMAHGTRASHPYAWLAASSAGWVCVIAFIESYGYGQSLYDDIAFVLLLTKFCSSSAQRHELAEIYWDLRKSQRQKLALLAPSLR
jgi:hypothetical protein